MVEFTKQKCYFVSLETESDHGLAISTELNTKQRRDWWMLRQNRVQNPSSAVMTHQQIDPKSGEETSLRIFTDIFVV